MYSNIPIKLPEIDLEGFQVVKGDMFINSNCSHSMMMSIWPDSISFSQASIDALNKCERVRMEINTAAKSIVVIPVTIQDKDNIRWVVINKGITRRIQCVKFTRMIYRIWGWDEDLAYKARGKLVSANNKVMLMFSFENATSWKYAKPK